MQRARDGSEPGQREDHNKLGLAIEGGAMRGVVTAGMVTGLEMLGLRDVFDVVYGSSGGASNGAYFVAGQAAYGTTIYYDHINSQDFIDFWRPLRNRRVVDFRFVTDHVMVELVVLDWQAVISSAVAPPIALRRARAPSRIGWDRRTFRSPASGSGFAIALARFPGARAGGTVAISLLTLLTKAG